MRPGLLLGGLAALLLLVCGEAAPGLMPLRVGLEVRGADVSLDLDGARHHLRRPDEIRWQRVHLQQPGPEDREVQIDGSDTVGRGDRDPAAIRALAATPLYAIAAWLRDEASFSRWDSARLIDLADGRVLADSPAEAPNVTLPTDFKLELALRHPEAPVHVWLMSSNVPFQEGLELNRNTREARWVREPAKVLSVDAEHWFFPEQPAPFAVNLLQLLGRAAAASYALLAGVALLGSLSVRSADALERTVVRSGPGLAVVFPAALLVGSAWVSFVLYHQLPHILDAGEYYLQAGMFATGHLWFEPPPLAKNFANYSQVVWDHRWFSHYPPGAGLAYAIGRLAGLAWLIGPLAAVSMVVSIGIAARTWFGPRVGLAALGLGSLSPFVLFHAGSFMSHPIAGAALGGSLAAFTRGDVSRRRWPWQYVLAGVLLGCGFLTREMSTVLFGLPLIGWLVVHGRWRALVLLALGTLPGLAAYLAYNAVVTRDPLIIPRVAADFADHPGFGDVGQFGRHTLAAGLVNADQDLNGLQFDLFGWPSLLALSVMLLPFVLGKAGKRDVLLGAGALLFVVGFVPFFAHGIGAMGPRFYYEALPWFVLLAARGLQAAVDAVADLGLPRASARLGAVGLVGLLSAYAYGYYVPRLVERRVDFAALSGGRRYSYPFVTNTLTGPRLRGFDGPTIVLVPDEGIFKTISAMNCPLLDRAHVADCEVLFIHAGDGDLQRVLEAYPNRTVLKAEGKAGVVALSPVAPELAQR